jgi:hypothetical protein
MNIGILFIVFVLSIFQQIYPSFSVPNEDLIVFFESIQKINEKITNITFSKQEQDSYRSLTQSLSTVRAQFRLFNRLYYEKLLQSTNNLAKYFDALKQFNNAIDAIDNSIAVIKNQINTMEEGETKNKVSQLVHLFEQKKVLFVGIRIILEIVRVQQKKQQFLAEQLEEQKQIIKEYTTQAKTRFELLESEKIKLAEKKKEKNRVIVKLKRYVTLFSGAYAIVATIVAGYFFVKYKMHAGMLKSLLRSYVPGFIYVYP